MGRARQARPLGEAALRHLSWSPGVRGRRHGTHRRRFRIPTLSPEVDRGLAQPGAMAGTEEAMSEAHVPTEQPQTGKEARVPPSNVGPRRPGDHQGSPSQGPQAALGLIWRVRHRRSFQAFRGAQRSRSGPLAISWVPDDDPGLPPRVAFSIGRRVGSAVTRNRLRRRLRELMRERAGELAPGSYLVAARPEATGLSFSDLRAALAEALAGLPRPNGMPA